MTWNLEVGNFPHVVFTGFEIDKSYLRFMCPGMFEKTIAVYSISGGS